MSVELRQGTLLSHKGVKNTTIGALILTSFQGLNEEAGVKSWSGLSNWSISTWNTGISATRLKHRSLLIANMKSHPPPPPSSNTHTPSKTILQQQTTSWVFSHSTLILLTQRQLRFPSSEASVSKLLHHPTWHASRKGRIAYLCFWPIKYQGSHNPFLEFGNLAWVVHRIYWNTYSHLLVNEKGSYQGYSWGEQDNVRRKNQQASLFSGNSIPQQMPSLWLFQWVGWVFKIGWGAGHSLLGIAVKGLFSNRGLMIYYQDFLHMLWIKNCG